MVDYPDGLAEYINVPPAIGTLLSANVALIGPLTTTLGLEDVYDLLEVRSVDAHNARLWQAWHAKKEDR